MTTEAIDAVAAQAQADVTVDDEQTHEVIITMNGHDTRVPMDSLEVDINTPDAQVLNAVRDIIDEVSSVDDEYGQPSFTVRRATNSDTIYVYPKPVAG